MAAAFRGFLVRGAAFVLAAAALVTALAASCGAAEAFAAGFSASLYK